MVAVTVSKRVSGRLRLVAAAMAWPCRLAILVPKIVKGEPPRVAVAAEVKVRPPRAYLESRVAPLLALVVLAVVMAPALLMGRLASLARSFVALGRLYPPLFEVLADVLTIIVVGRGVRHLLASLAMVMQLVRALLTALKESSYLQLFMTVAVSIAVPLAVPLAATVVPRFIDAAMYEGLRLVKPCRGVGVGV